MYLGVNTSLKRNTHDIGVESHVTDRVSSVNPVQTIYYLKRSHDTGGGVVTKRFFLFPYVILVEVRPCERTFIFKQGCNSYVVPC